MSPVIFAILFYIFVVKVLPRFGEVAQQIFMVTILGSTLLMIMFVTFMTIFRLAEEYDIIFYIEDML